MRGFTLIELLVVIAIIGILSSVVLASLQTARMKSCVREFSVSKCKADHPTWDKKTLQSFKDE